MTLVGMYFQTPSYRDCSASVILLYKKSSKSCNAKTLLAPWRKKKSKNLMTSITDLLSAPELLIFIRAFRG